MHLYKSSYFGNTPGLAEKTHHIVSFWTVKLQCQSKTPSEQNSVNRSIPPTLWSTVVSYIQLRNYIQTKNWYQHLTEQYLAKNETKFLKLCITNRYNTMKKASHICFSSSCSLFVYITGQNTWKKSRTFFVSICISALL